ncbi:MAG: glycosyltransferase family 2 protein [Candidatus Eremiobacteraeota bacterium]|nr:glycosyltransferase family 2 protein [Candidatus Eremiobacteraeota bacterium]MBV8365836.1 glycosyltransferase family 2 protein [Candidatus Eremiobacteraeota bacterium]
MSLTITTIVPTFRRPVSLERALHSVLSQSYRDIVVRVYDNASGDATRALVERLAAADSRVSYIGRPENIGAAENFIRAFDDVATPLCSFLSDDDYLLPGFFELAAAALDADKEAGLYAGSTLEFDVNGELRYAPVLAWPRTGRYRPDEAVLNMLDNRHPTWTGVVFRAASLRAAGGLDRAASEALDLDAELRVAAAGPIIVSFEPAAVYTVHPARVSAEQTAAVIPSYERIITHLEEANALTPAVRREAGFRLRRQLRMKLLEISVKAQVRGDSAAAQRAAHLLRTRHGWPFLGGALAWGLWVCSRFAPAQALLARLETLRLRLRAAKARRQAQRAAMTSPGSAGKLPITV